MKTTLSNAVRVIALAVLFVLWHCQPTVAQDTPGSVSAGAQQEQPKVDVEPKLVTSVQPAYPEEALRKNIEGVVYLKAHVSDSGRVTDVLVLKSTAAILQDAAATAVKKWIFEPARLKDKPVDTWVVVPVRFALKKDKS